jgi:hypothetical protein
MGGVAIRTILAKDLASARERIAFGKNFPMGRHLRQESVSQVLVRYLGSNLAEPLTEANPSATKPSCEVGSPSQRLRETTSPYLESDLKR